MHTAHTANCEHYALVSLLFNKTIFIFDETVSDSLYDLMEDFEKSKKLWLISEVQSNHACCMLHAIYVKIL